MGVRSQGATLWLAVWWTMAGCGGAPEGRRAPDRLTEDQISKLRGSLQVLIAHPLDPRLESYRFTALDWMSRTSQIQVVMCADVLVGLDAHPYQPILVRQLALSTLLATLERSDEAPDRREVLFLAVEAWLRSYEALRRARPGAAHPKLDALLKARDTAGLRDYVEQRVCPGSGRQVSLEI
jgi:hypothetical protein